MRHLLVLNPPYNPQKETPRFCVKALSLIDVEMCALVLPGRYARYDKLFEVLPPFWHVVALEEMDRQCFEQPLLEKTSKNLRIVLVVAVRKNYPRQSPVASLSMGHSIAHQQQQQQSKNDDDVISNKWHRLHWF